MHSLQCKCINQSFTILSFRLPSKLFWQQDEMCPVALIPEGNNDFPGFLHPFLQLITGGWKIPATSSLAACCRFVTDWAWSTQQTTARCTIRTDRDTRNQEFCQKTPRWHDSITLPCLFFIFNDKFFIRRRFCNNRWGKDLMAAAPGTKRLRVRH